MILLDLHVETDEDDEDIRVLQFEFSNDARLTFECPTGLTAMEAMSAFREFIDMAEQILFQETTIYH